MKKKSVFTNCARPTDYAQFKSVQIFNQLMRGLDLHCQLRQMDGYHSYIFVGSSDANLKQGRTLHLSIRDDACIELITTQNCVITRSVYVETGDSKRFHKLMRELQRKLITLYPAKKGHINNEFRSHSPIKIFRQIKTKPVKSAILPSQAHPRLRYS